MTTQPFNPIAPIANSARQINEQLNLSAKSLGDSLTQGANALLGAAAQAPLVPPLPGAQANGNPARGNPNGNGNGGLPTLQQLLPAQALQPLSQVEDVIFPAGFPRPTQVLLGTPRPRRRVPTPEEEQAAMAAAATPMVNGRAIGVEGAGEPISRRRSRALGVRSV